MDKKGKIMAVHGDFVQIDDMGTRARAEIYIAAGCFWGVEAYYKRVFGILETKVGYANGQVPETSYEELARTGHVETVRLLYDSNKIDLAEILERFYRLVDPFSLNRQGNDIGTQYRSGLYYTDDMAAKLITYSLDNFEGIQGRKTAIEVAPLEHFIEAEEYHQDYLGKKPNGYCHINIFDADKPLFPGSDLPTDETLKESLSPLSYDILRKAATERPFTSPLDQTFTEGIYVDIATGQPLFSSRDKYDAGCGWPSFTKPITSDILDYRVDESIPHRTRVEVTSKNTNHLGHVFEDGPVSEGSLRYCINGAALRFIPFLQMDEAGYAELKPFVVRIS